MDPRTEKLAKVLVQYSTEVKKGDKVLIEGDEGAAPLIKAVYAEALKIGAFPTIIMTPAGTDNIFYKYASDEQIKYVHKINDFMIDEFDVHIALGGASNTKSLSKVPSEKIVAKRNARRDLMTKFLKYAAEGKVRWTYTIFPTSAYAQDAEMSLSEYEDFVYNACLPDMENPVEYWRNFSAWQDKIIKWLDGKKKIHVKGPETDLTMSIEGRKFVNCDAHENMPDGEVFTGPVEDSVNGHVLFSFPAINDGKEVSGIRLWFKNGVVTKATAEKNEEYLLKMIGTDEGSKRVGEFAIGTNKGITNFTKEILYDEKINGSFHMALGAGYPETGSTNESAIHWDMICDMRKGGEIWVDGELLYKDGDFVIDL